MISETGALLEGNLDADEFPRYLGIGSAQDALGLEDWQRDATTDVRVERMTVDEDNGPAGSYLVTIETVEGGTDSWSNDDGRHLSRSYEAVVKYETIIRVEHDITP